MSKSICDSCPHYQSDVCPIYHHDLPFDKCPNYNIGASQPRQTVFHRITASPEVLAEKLVYKTTIKTSKILCDRYGDGVGTRYDIKEVWKSTITEDTYIGETEAIVATLAKLKEVDNGNRI